MKKSLTKFVFIISLLSGFLTGCKEGAANFSFLNGVNGGYWGDDDYYYDDDDDWDDYFYEDDDDDEDEKEDSKKNSSSENKNSSSSSRNNSPSSQGNNNNSEATGGGTFDEDSTKFGHSFSGTGAGEVAIYAKTSNCTDTDLIVPSTYVDSSGNRYQVTMDCGNGFNALSAVSITLPDGFKKIVEGFDNCMYLKTIYLPSSITKLEAEIIVSCISLQKIDYKGTKTQWNAIEKDDRWNFQAKAFVISCSDGIIEMQSWAESHSS